MTVGIIEIDAAGITVARPDLDALSFECRLYLFVVGFFGIERHVVEVREILYFPAMTGIEKPHYLITAA